jgi:hypothetical protein
MCHAEEALGSEAQAVVVLARVILVALLASVLCAMPQKPRVAKHRVLMFLLDHLPLCQFSSSSLELDEE